MGLNWQSYSFPSSHPCASALICGQNQWPDLVRGARNMNRLLVFLLLFATFPLNATAATPATKRPPNVVVFLVDDLGATDLGCFGSTFYETPNVDRLAAEGMRFTAAYSACPVCSPTRASMMTGRYPQRTGITDY